MKRKNLFAIALIIVFAFGAIFADSYFKTGMTRTAGSYLAPVGVVVTNFGSGFSDFFKNIGNISNLQKENSRLKSDLNKSLVEIARLSEAQKENDSLKNDLKFKKENKFDLVPAYVIFFDPSNIRDTITIDIGTDDGVKEGDVAVSEGFLIGRLTGLTKNTAKIILISDPDSAVPVNLVNSSVTGIVKGKIGSGLVLDQVPQSDEVGRGDLLATSGLGGQYPKGLLVGKIEEIQQISGSIFQAIEVRAMLDLGALQRVMVIRK
jgi:rod shape-determining protein MreC